jgi:nucleotide-binding universal stress UspA family protein
MTNILVPTDFSEVCENAAFHACEVARFLNGQVILLHVINSDTHAYLKKQHAGVELINQMLKTLQEKLRREFSIDVSIVALEGSIFEKIKQTAEKKGADLVFLGTHGKVGIQKLTGSFALKLVTQLPVPTVVVQERKFGEGYRVVVIPVSNHQQIDLKCHWAVSVAKIFRAEVHLIQIYEENPTIAEIIGSATTEIAGHLVKNGIKVVVSHARHAGDFAGQIISYSKDIHAELIQIITNSVPSQSEFMLGPWDEKMIFNQVQIPVMCINPLPL